MSVEAADLTALLSQSPNHSRPTGSHELKQLRPFFFLPLSSANAHAASRHAWKSHDKTGPSLPKRMSGGWNRMSPPQSGGERHSDHKHKVMKRHYDSVREREAEIQHKGMGLSERSGLRPLCVRRTEGDFHSDRRVQSVLCEGCGYSLEITELHELLYGKHRSPQRSQTARAFLFLFVFFFLLWKSSGDVFLMSDLGWHI